MPITNSKPLVSILIPHFNGVEILRGCLRTLSKTTYENYEVVVIDNGSTDASVEMMKAEFPRVKIILSETNLGYAGGCNLGYEKTWGKYAVFLNNDTEQEPDWLTHLVATAESDETIAAVQPKILSIQARNRGEKIFDYAGAAGGMMDVLGYPYAKGRIFQTIEHDDGQYDNATDIFWASGTAMFVRRNYLEKVGSFDGDFFAHMEEIDLCWRLLLAGYKIYASPKSVVYHYGGATLAVGTPKKIYLNHRNNTLMVCKNLSLARLLVTLVCRVVIETASIAVYFSKPEKGYAGIVPRAFWWNLTHIGLIRQKRRAVQKLRKVSDSEVFRGRTDIFLVIGKIFSSPKKRA
jgi:GT2 family glycosyltransferase